MCCKCGFAVVGAVSGCTVQDKLYHKSCFKCDKCAAHLFEQGGCIHHDEMTLCEECYMVRMACVSFIRQAKLFHDLCDTHAPL